MTVRVLLVEDELEIANVVKDELDFEGYEVSLAHDGVTGLTTAREAKFDLILLDWMLPGLTGVEICRRLRQTANKVPIIFLTAQNEICDRVDGLDAGANDYLTKPFSTEELLARVRSTLRHAADDNSSKHKNVFQFAQLKLDLIIREVYQGDRQVQLALTCHQCLLPITRLSYSMFNKVELLSDRTFS